MTDFDQIFKNDGPREMGRKLRAIVESHFDEIDVNIAGGSKVKLALYSRNGPNNVLCGIQEGSDQSCMFYVHHIDQISHERLKFSGKGKHAKRIKFTSIDEVVEDDIIWLLSKVDERAPF